MKQWLALMSPGMIGSCGLMRLESHRCFGFDLGRSGIGGLKAFDKELGVAKIVVARNSFF